MIVIVFRKSSSNRIRLENSYGSISKFARQPNVAAHVHVTCCNNFVTSHSHQPYITYVYSMCCHLVRVGKQRVANGNGTWCVNCTGAWLPPVTPAHCRQGLPYYRFLLLVRIIMHQQQHNIIQIHFSSYYFKEQCTVYIHTIL